MLNLIVAAQVLKIRAANLLKDRDGVTSMEYGIIAAVTVAVVGGAIGGIGGSLSQIWTGVGTALTAGATAATAAG